jgi:hypothetical protein
MAMMPDFSKNHGKLKRYEEMHHLGEKIAIGFQVLHSQDSMPARAPFHKMLRAVPIHPCIHHFMSSRLRAR